MKKLALMTALLLAFSGAAYGDSLSVTSTAAMGGVAQNDCSGDNQPGPCGLEVFHDNSSLAYVQDDSPADESVYRATFLYNPNNIQASTTEGPWRQMILKGIAPNVNRNQFNCPDIAFINGFMLFDVHWGTVGANCSILAWAPGNVCGQQGTARRERRPSSAAHQTDRPSAHISSGTKLKPISS